ncbi:ABC transporter ATP-binding protein [Desulfosporosinus sp. FKB]|uniref:ABC transporter ATP-binding protein n=1 Tax=Desulfosporosinus sp. FKB TaxID=1969835 RepID=UPI001482F9F6|nr:ABC transporter ATP-binding protein [Desulfosporosinus sp. FKB]
MVSVRIDHLSCTYNGAKEPALKDISFTANTGEIIVISGNNGSGKSTLLACISDIIPSVISGRIEGQIHRQEDLVENSWGAAAIGVVLQDSDVFLMEKVYDELAFPLRSSQVEGPELEERILKTAHLLGLEDLLERKIISLSGGERQKAAIATALVGDPPLLLFDEPTEQLDPESAEFFGEILIKLAAGGKTIFVCLHNPRKALNWLARHIILKGGRMIYDGLLTEMKLSEGEQLSRNINLQQDILEATDTYDNQAYSEAPVLELQNLTYHYEKGTGIEDINLIINRKEIFALMGPNGAGKSTLIQHFIGLLKPQRGRVLVKGKDINGVPAWKLAREIGILFQNPDDQIFNARVDEEIAWNLTVRGIPKNDAVEKAHKLITDFSLEGIEAKHPHDLNRSLRQWVALASVIITNPEILILDEPTKMMDKVFLVKVMKWLLEYRQKGGTIVLVTHDSELSKYADRTGIIVKGCLTNIKSNEKIKSKFL